ncbi:hypothetical protein CEUSTIGMA_g13344.t1 [Chlamydomonas eustigma]|uniref:Transposase-associated domain-containing protein n=1 Tax=Chlamydomonas eustigma TaxID=1157962 RepID=A0A250XS88_9CHLO|nr:hypothetical protein CEUSTIGMA_g13344.t1 [Chlamydomonas eustigma]|eukprot:GAX85928.1 hypothetical protein CEUSTIGMA_g13344.t1 [Chlamydomonas eustigma]
MTGNLRAEVPDVASEDYQLLLDVRDWLSTQLAIKLQHKNSAKAFDNSVSAMLDAKHVSSEFKAALNQWAPNYKKALSFMERLGSGETEMFKYDICGNSDCCMVYRAQFRDALSCPACGCPRYNGSGRPMRTMFYMPISGWIKFLCQQEDIVKALGWWYSTQRPVEDGVMSDIYDSPLWKHFSNNPQMAAQRQHPIYDSTNTGINLALGASTNGASPHNRSTYTFWPIAVACLNFPPWLRHLFLWSHICCIVPGPRAPADFQPYLEIMAHELLLLYWHGTDVSTSFGTFNVKAMLLQFVCDYRGYPKLFRYRQSPSRVGACHVCGVEGCNSHGLGKMIYANAWTQCQHDQERRERGATLNGGAASAANSTNPPALKSHECFMTAAAKGDEALFDGIGMDSDRHPAQTSGVYGSHALQLLPYWRENIMRRPDPAHTLQGEGLALAKQVTGVEYKSRMEKIGKYEINVNKRWIPILSTWIRATSTPSTITQRQSSRTPSINDDGYVVRPTASSHTALSRPSSIRVRGGVAKHGQRGQFISRLGGRGSSLARHAVAASETLPDSVLAPFLCSPRQVKEATSRAEDLLSKGIVPMEISYVQLQYLFTIPSNLKMHDFIIILGPIFKYLTQGFFNPVQRRVLYRYIDMLSMIWSRAVESDKFPILLQHAKEALDMEAYFPAWEQDINRHNVLHLVESMACAGPQWAFTMFPFERMWKR